MHTREDTFRFVKEALYLAKKKDEITIPMSPLWMISRTV